MEKKIKTWLEVWDENYNQTSAVGQWVGKHSKETYKGDIYIPWAVMVGALYRLDEGAQIIKVQNSDGGYVHTDKLVLETTTEKGTILSTVVSHMVRVKVIFMGKEFEEIYPIQDQDYSASKVYDQNKVNRALQRCMTRVISMATGLAWNLYESVDLQFDSNESMLDKAKATSPKKKSKSTDANVSDTNSDKSTSKTVVNDLDVQSEPAEEGDDNLAKFLDRNRENGRVIALVDKYNQYLPKKYTYEGTPLTFDLEADTLEVLESKVSCVDKPETMLNALRKVGS